MTLTLESDGRSSEEVGLILGKINLYRSYDANKSKPFRDELKKTCYKAFTDHAKRVSGNNEEKFIELCKLFNYKSNYSDTLSIKNFSELAIEDLVERYKGDGFKSRFKFINESYTCGGYVPAQLVQVIGAPSTGKSLFLQSEAISFMAQGKRVHYLALGDLNELDFVTRMICMHAKLPKRQVEENILRYYEMYKDHFVENLGLTIVSSGTVKPTSYVEYMIQIADQYDVFMVDYDSNFAKDPSLSMYDQGGDIYDKLTQLTRLGKLVFVASQPRREFFHSEKIPGDSSGESSRKFHIADMVITIGRNPDAKMFMGYFTIGKSRRGTEREVPYIRTAEGLFYECSDAIYIKYKNDKAKGYFMRWDELEGEDILEAALEGD